MMLVDSHCHLNFPDFKEDLDGVIHRAREAGVGVMQTICTGMDEFDEVHAIARKYEGVYCSVGVHPNNTPSPWKGEGWGGGPANGDETPSLILPLKGGGNNIYEALIEKTSHDKVIGIGETGLDYHYISSPRRGEVGRGASSENRTNISQDGPHPNPPPMGEGIIKEIQKKSFVEHIKAARESGLPLIVHARDADEDMAEMLRSEMAKGKFKGLLHCFTSSKYLAEEAVKLGFYISLSGIISFKSAGSIRDAIADIPMDKLLVETDAPYLAPVPYRGKRNEPSFVIHTNKILAGIKNISEEECAKKTTENFFRLFDKASPGLSTCA